MVANGFLLLEIILFGISNTYPLVLIFHHNHEGTYFTIIKMRGRSERGERVRRRERVKIERGVREERE
jgi:hypothetical protein